MPGFIELLRTNRNYRYTWTGQIVSEIGDHFNNIAVFSLALGHTGSGLVVTGVMLSRAVPAIMAGPIAGVVLDRFDRRRIMIASDLVRAVVALGFLLTLRFHYNWLLYVLSGLLMFASPFFTSGRTAILPTITNREELHTANSLTQTTQWVSLIIGTFAAGTMVSQVGYRWAFVANSVSFLISTCCIYKLVAPGTGFRARREALNESHVIRPWSDYVQGLRYMRSNPLILGIGLIGVGWATGGGAAQILFTLFGDVVFGRGASGIGIVWGSAGIGLLVGGIFAHRYGQRIAFSRYKWTISLCYLVHGGAYVVFSQMRSFHLALVFIALSRAAVAISSVLNYSQLLRHVPNHYRGRVFSTNESMVWATMLLSMSAAGIATQYYDPRSIGVVAGILSSTTAVFWAWAVITDRLPEPAEEGVEPEEVEVHGDPRHSG